MEPVVQAAVIVCGSGLLALGLIVWAARRQSPPPSLGTPSRQALYQRLLDAVAAAARDPGGSRQPRRDVDGAVNACVLSAPPAVVAVARRCQAAMARGPLPADLEAELVAALRADLGLEPLGPGGRVAAAAPGTSLPDGGS